jgi:hypothetical protein
MRANAISDGAFKISTRSKPQTFDMASPTPTYLSFGFGRNACPGRFLATQEVKMFMAYVLLNYEIEPLRQARLDNQWYGDIVAVPMQAKMTIKRRKLTGERIPIPDSLTQDSARIV